MSISETGYFRIDGSYEDYIAGDRIPKHYRNPFLAQAMTNIKMIDTEGFVHPTNEKSLKNFFTSL